MSGLHIGDKHITCLNLFKMYNLLTYQFFLSNILREYESFFFHKTLINKEFVEVLKKKNKTRVEIFQQLDKIG